MSILSCSYGCFKEKPKSVLFGNNAEHLSGIPVFELEAFLLSLSGEEKTDIEVLIATPENIMPEVEQSLDACGLFCHVRLTSLRWAELIELSLRM